MERSLKRKTGLENVFSLNFSKVSYAELDHQIKKEAYALADHSAKAYIYWMDYHYPSWVIPLTLGVLLTESDPSF